MSELAAPPALEFAVVGAEPIEHAAMPGVRFHVHVTEPEGREVYAVALSTQIQIDPARRPHDEATRARLVELFGAPERWGATTSRQDSLAGRAYNGGGGRLADGAASPPSTSGPMIVNLVSPSDKRGPPGRRNRPRPRRRLPLIFRLECL